MLGTGLSDTLWPYHPHPLSDELFSSWLIRLASGNSLKLHTAAALLFGRSVQIWNRDIDSTVSDETVRRMCQATGLSFEQGFATTLRAYEGLLYEHHNVHGANRWILPAGIFHRVRHRPWLVYCPLCLIQDGETPYFRRHWRLAFCTMCERHGVMVSSACPQCESPVVPFRRELGHRQKLRMDSLVLCASCDFDLRRTPVYGPPYTDAQVLMSFRAWLMFYDIGWWWIGSTQLHYAQLYFDGLYRLLRFLASRRGEALLMLVAHESGVSQGAYGAGSRVFNLMPLSQRHALLMAALWLLMDWPSRFLQACKQARVRASDLWRDGELPFWLSSTVQHHLASTQYTPSDPEARNAIEHLLAVGHRVTPRTICAALGMEKDCATGAHAYKAWLALAVR